MTVSLQSVCQTLAAIAPLRLAESWDNVGLLVGDRNASIEKVMTCLTVTPDVVDEAIAEGAGLIVAHHPLPFKPITRITTDSVAGEMLWRLIGAKIAVYSAHTAFDSAATGINQRWADTLELESIEPLVLNESNLADDEESPLSSEGSGRLGRLRESVSLGELVAKAAKLVGTASPRWVGASDRRVSKVAIACGSGGSFLAAARRRGCDAMITGEATFHTCLEARSTGLALILTGHYWSERFAMERLAESLASELPEIRVWPSHSESDPISV